MICLHSCSLREESYINLYGVYRELHSAIIGYCSTERGSHIHAYVAPVGEGEDR